MGIRILGETKLTCLVGAHSAVSAHRTGEPQEGACCLCDRNFLVFHYSSHLCHCDLCVFLIMYAHMARKSTDFAICTLSCVSSQTQDKW